MWPFEAKFPENKPQDVDGREFDYVVVGGKHIPPTHMIIAVDLNMMQEALLALLWHRSCPKTLP